MEYVTDHNIIVRWLENDGGKTRVYQTRPWTCRFVESSSLRVFLIIHNRYGKCEFYFREIISIITDYIIFMGLLDPLNVSVFCFDAPLRYVFGRTVMHKSELVEQVNRHLYSQDNAVERTTRSKNSCGFETLYNTKFHLQPQLYNLLKGYETIPPREMTDDDIASPPPPVYKIAPFGKGEGTKFKDLMALLLRYVEEKDLFLDLSSPDIAILFRDPLSQCLQIGVFHKFQCAAVLSRCIIPGTLLQMSGLAVVRQLFGQGPYWPRKVDLSTLEIPIELKNVLLSLGAQQREGDGTSNSRCVSPMDNVTQ